MKLLYYLDKEKKLKIGELVIVAKIISLIFLAIAAFAEIPKFALESKDLFGIKYSVGGFRILLAFSVILLLFVFLILIIRFYQKRFINLTYGSSKQILYDIVETYIFLLLDTLLILVSGLNQSPYKIIFLFIMISVTIQHGLRYGLIVSSLCSAIVLAIDLLAVSIKPNSYFQIDLMLCGVYIMTTWLLGYYRSVEMQCSLQMANLNATKEYNRLRGEFFSNITHELKTPLKIIFSTLQLMNTYLSKDNSEIDEKMSKYMKFIRQNSYRQLRLINNIIDITKIDSGYMSINFVNQDIVKIIEDITTSVVPYAEYSGVTVIFDTEIEEKIIACDPDKIERIILNLLSNAIKFTEPSDSIFVSIHEADDCVIIKVKDTGIGIPEEKQKIIFDRFIQADNSSAKAKEGSGIGLSLSKSLVEMHNGKISVDSQPGKGSEFIIELPNVTALCDKDSNDYLLNKNSDNSESADIEFYGIYSIDS